MANSSSQSWDERAFNAKWAEVKDNDPEYKQHTEEWKRQLDERRRFYREGRELQGRLNQASNEEERRVLSRELEITKIMRDLANSRRDKANAQKNQRAFELRLEMLGQITDAPASEVEEAERIIQQQQERVEKFETQANEQEARLNQDGSGGSAHGSSGAASAANTSDDPPNLPTLLRILLPLSRKWMNIGVMLSLNYQHLTAIETRCGGVPDDCLQEMLKEWLEQDDPPPTKSALVDAVKVYNPSLAEEISAL